LCEDIAQKYYELPKGQRNGAVSITASAACFVPKPFTPFQWEPQDSLESFETKCRGVKRSIKSKHIRFNYHEAGLSVLEAVFARGDRRVFETLVSAYRHGARFDSWSDCFKPEAWAAAFAETGLSAEFYASRERGYDEILPWDFIDIGVTKDFLISESKKARLAETTPDCRVNCAGCGAKRFGGGVCYEG
jgi:hypothetical protein